MKREEGFSSSFFLRSDSTENTGVSNNCRNLYKSKEIQKVSKNNNAQIKKIETFDSLPFISDKAEQMELQDNFNNFNIDFFLPKSLQENLEKEEEPEESMGQINEKIENKNNICFSNFNPINPFNEINQVNMNNNNNEECINLETIQQIKQGIQNYYQNNCEFGNNLPKKKANIFPINMNDINNQNNNISNDSDEYNKMNYYLNMENEKKRNMPINLYPQEEQDNNVINGQFFINNNNYFAPVNQINFNFNQFQQNDFGSFDYRNKFDNKEFDVRKQENKKTTKRIIDEYTMEMFGRRGWICELCNNFNYETRKKCNRCHIAKKPKKINTYLLAEKFKNLKHKNDWHCPDCGNFNYSFRIICNRCQKRRIK